MLYQLNHRELEWCHTDSENQNKLVNAKFSSLWEKVWLKMCKNRWSHLTQDNTEIYSLLKKHSKCFFISRSLLTRHRNHPCIYVTSPVGKRSGRDDNQPTLILVLPYNIREPRSPCCSTGSVTVMAPGRNFVLSLVLSLAYGLKLHKQYFVRIDDMQPSKLCSSAQRCFFRAVHPVSCFYLPQSCVATRCKWTRLTIVI